MDTDSLNPDPAGSARPPVYRSYLLRFWEERGDQAAPVWRFSLEDPQTARRAFSPNVDEYIVPINPSAADVGPLCEMLREHGYELAVVGTINATNHPGQAAIVNALLCSDVRTVAVALRMPCDLLAYPAAPTYVCTYSIQPPAIEALAQALFGRLPFAGRLPVSMPAQ